MTLYDAFALRVSDLQARLLELKRYSNKLEEEVVHLKEGPPCHNKVEDDHHVTSSINTLSIPSCTPHTLS